MKLVPVVARIDWLSALRGRPTIIQVQVRAFALVTVVAAVLAGCGGSSHPSARSIGKLASPVGSSTAVDTSPSSSAAQLPGYLALANNGAIFLQWQRQGDGVTGKLSESYYDSASPSQLQAQADNFTGTITGSQISITMDTGTTWSGTFSGSSMTLSYTGSDGSIQTLDFHPGNAAQYNAAVAATKARVAGAVTRQQHEQAVTSAQQQVDSDASGLAADVQSLQGDTSSLNQDAFASDLSSIRSDVQTVQGDLQTVRSDSSDVACSDAGVASNDAGVAANDESVLHNDVQVYGNDVQTLLGGIDTIHADQEKLASDNAPVPNYSSPNVPAASGIATAVEQARAAVAAEQRRVKAAEAQAAQLVAQARSIAAQAHTAGCG